MPEQEKRRRSSDRARGPETATRWLLVLFLVGLCERGYLYYSLQLLHQPQVWMDVVQGTSSAPEQYRIGVVDAAYWLSRHVGWQGHWLRMSRAFGLFDVAGAVAAVLLLYGLVERSELYRRGSAAMRWFASAGFVALALYALDWTIWYQKVGTLPTAGLVALMVWLWTPRGSRSAGAGPTAEAWTEEALTAAALLALVAVQSLIRADIALVLCAGVLAASGLRLGGPLALRRGAAMATSAAGVGVALGVQLYLMKVAYPQASYQGVPALMLSHDALHASLWVATVIYLAPLAWTTREAVRQRRMGDGVGAAVLLSSWGYAALWITMGRLDEVRIFLPMALAVTPLTVEMALRRMAGDAA